MGALGCDNVEIVEGPMAAGHPGAPYDVLIVDRMLPGLDGLGIERREIVGVFVGREALDERLVGDVILAPSGGHTFYVNSANGKVRYEDIQRSAIMGAPAAG